MAIALFKYFTRVSIVSLECSRLHTLVTGVETEMLRMYINKDYWLSMIKSTLRVYNQLHLSYEM